MATLYEALGVREDATHDEIKRAYRRAAMKAHPDRNVGREASAHARFQEIKEAYAILSDPAQRRVYDAVYAEKMAELARRRQEEERLQAEREAARQAKYARFVSLAMRYAERGYNRDVVFGVLLGRDCELELAGQIADSVAALHASRQQPAPRDVQGHDGTPQGDDDVAQSEEAERSERRSQRRSDRQAESDKTPHSDAAQRANNDARTNDDARSSDDARTRAEQAQANLFSTIWHSVFGVRP